MMLKMGRFKRALSIGALALATTTLMLGAPKAQARVDVGIDLGAPTVVAPPVVMAPPAPLAVPTLVAPPVIMAPPTVLAVPPVIGALGFGVGHEGWYGGRGWHERGHERR